MRIPKPVLTNITQFSDSDGIRNKIHPTTKPPDSIRQTCPEGPTVPFVVPATPLRLKKYGQIGESVTDYTTNP